MQLTAHSTRLITACLVLALPVVAIVFGGWVLLVVLAVFTSLSLLEFYAMFWPGRLRIQTKAMGIILSLLLLATLATNNHTWTLLALLATFWIGNMLFLHDYSKSGEQADYLNGMVFLAGLIFLPLTTHFFLFMNPMECVLVLLAVMVSDTAAFYSGTYWGKAKIWPQISPKKSWVGSIGSMAGCIAVVTALGILFGKTPWWTYLYLGIILNLAAQFGDFFESALKRKLSIKDSGAILPGHGGLIDRLDSLLLALPVYMAIVTAFPGLILDPGFEQLLTSLVTP